MHVRELIVGRAEVKRVINPETVHGSGVRSSNPTPNATRRSASRHWLPVP
jgi:hypothetical protein